MILQRNTISLFVVMTWCGMAMGQTEWSTPEVVASAAGTSATLLTGAMLASGSDGNLALTYHGHWGLTTGTEPHVINLERHSDVYAAFSGNRGGAWSAPRQVSDPSTLNTGARAIPGQPGEFHITWMSGDPLSGFRFNMARTTSAAEEMTSQTWIQDEDTTEVGFCNPQIAHSGSNLILVRDAVRQQTHTQRWQFCILVLPASENGWTDYSSPLLTNAWGWYNHSIAAAGSDVIAAGSSYNPLVALPSTGYDTALRISRNSGTNWQHRYLEHSPGVRVNAANPFVATDRTGTWLNFSNVVSAAPELRVQKSSDVGTSWSAPQVLLHTSWPVSSAATDGDGRWIVTLRQTEPNGETRYIWSSNNGDSWSQLESVPGSRSGVTGETCVYLGAGRWGLAWTDDSVVKMATMSWGNSAVDVWRWY